VRRTLRMGGSFFLFCFSSLLSSLRSPYQPPLSKGRSPPFLHLPLPLPLHTFCRLYDTAAEMRVATVSVSRHVPPGTICVTLAARDYLRRVRPRSCTAQTQTEHRSPGSVASPLQPGGLNANVTFFACLPPPGNASLWALASL
jgi:hypothetical protein